MSQQSPRLSCQSLWNECNWEHVIASHIWAKLVVTTQHKFLLCGNHNVVCLCVFVLCKCVRSTSVTMTGHNMNTHSMMCTNVCYATVQKYALL